MKSTVEKLPKAEIKISITATFEELNAYHDKALKAVQQVVEIDGFRKGHAPENQIVKQYGDMILLEEMANHFLRDTYPKLLEEHKVFPISEPMITITKLAKDNPFEATITTAVFPEVTLPDYKKIAKETKSEASDVVEEKEVEDVLKELQKSRAHNHDHHDHEHDENGHHPSHDEPVDESKFPPLDDAFAQSFGAEFKTLEDLKKKVKENLLLEKKKKASEKHRTALVEVLLAATKAELNDALVNNELDRMIAQMRGDISRFGGTWEEYLKHAGKTEAELRTDWKGDAERRALTQLMLAEISNKEKIAPTQEEIDVELVRLMAVVKDADEDRARAYLHQALSNDKVLNFLEEQSK
jgi:FKBP-type peptidyl-prolyl cis-trans isomerase (trigger factor)